MFKWLKCKLGWHEYYELIKLTEYGRKIGCRTCKKVFAMNDDAMIILPWDTDFEEFYHKTIRDLYK